MIDLRSDTVTRPTAGMMEAMMLAKVGDDVFGEDPTVIELEEKLANYFGMEAGLFCPSGTMTNQIALKILTQPQDEVICHKYSHIYLYEGGGLMANSQLSVSLLEGENGMLTAKAVKAAINPDDIHRPVSKVISLENTMNKGGGAIYSMDAIREISEVAHEHGLFMHLDGARLFNALVETEDDPTEYGSLFDTISICLSKGLGCPVGSVLLSTKDNIRKARRVRKLFGGGMRQAGFLAAAGNYALDHHVKRLKEDHFKAKKLGEVLEVLPWIQKVSPVATNIIIFHLYEGLDNGEILKKLKLAGINGVLFGPGQIRLVTHLDFDEAQLEEAISILQNFKP
ncbi:MAG: aminotransferase class I/II-fold pyridoxal phosphate-dependent enzyme [Bacteroidota bacterium]|jgi:threonine aldolase|nr:aminotransferase class I/II-fold pyridoxal phosphate-dependent enzyme [Bacteroidota bacterium]